MGHDTDRTHKNTCAVGFIQGNGTKAGLDFEQRKTDFTCVQTVYEDLNIRELFVGALLNGKPFLHAPPHMHHGAGTKPPAARCKMKEKVERK